MDTANTEALVTGKVCPLCQRTFSSEFEESFCPDDQTLLSVTTRDRLIGTRVLDKYEILAAIGTGGWSKVYIAEDHNLGQKVAVKVLHAHFAADPDKLQRFQNEARAARNLHHQNIAAVFDYGALSNGQPFLVMEFLDGSTMGEAAAAGRFPLLVDLVPVYQQITAALSEAHKAGVVHRDLKPGNIMLKFDQTSKEPLVKILDFGLAKVAAPDKADIHSLTRTGDTLGTPPYMSPEQCLGGKVDGRSDIYSLGCMLYESVCGRVPFTGDSPFDCMVKHLNEAPPPFASVAPAKSFPEGLESVVRKCLEKDADDRYQTVSQIAEDLALVLGLAPDAKAVPHYKRQKKKARLNLKLIAGLSAAIALVAAAGVFWFSSTSVKPQEAARKELIQQLVSGKRSGNPMQIQQAALSLLDLDTKLYGADSDEVANDHYEAGLACSQTNPASAMEHFAATSRIKQKLHGTDCKEMIEPVKGIADCYALLRLWPKAVETLQKRLELAQKNGTNVNVAMALCDLGACNLEAGNTDEAQKYLVEALAKCAKLQPRQIVVELNAASSLFAAQNRQGKLAESKAAAKQIEELAQLAPGEPALAPALINVGNTFASHGDPAGAEHTFGVLMEVQKKVLPPDSQPICVSLFSIARAQEEQGKFDQAQTNLEKAAGIAERLPDPSHMDLRIVLTEYLKVLNRLKKTDEANRTAARLSSVGGPPPMMPGQGPPTTPFPAQTNQQSLGK